MHLMILCALSSASWGLTPPPGWSLVSAERAAASPGEPGRGEILELADAAGTPSSLSLLLVKQGLTPQQSSLDGAGHLNLVLSDGRMGRAQWDGAGGRWLVLLVSPSVAPTVDPDALLLSAMAAPASSGPASVWGAAEVLSGGGDGSPWGDGTAQQAQAASWVSTDAVEAWSQDRALLGAWECSVLLGGAPAQLLFTFEPDGTVRLEKQVSGRTERHTGRWSTRGETLRLESLPGADATATNNTYQAMGGTLRFSYDRTRLTLYRR